MILLYHKVDLEPKTIWWISVDAFYRQLCDLRAYDVVRLDEYDPTNPRHVVITFDGVYSNVTTHAVPLLERFGYPFELFVIGDHLGGDNTFDTAEPPAHFASLKELQTAAQRGGRIQWHSRSHRRLSGGTTDEVERELSVPVELRDSFGPEHFRWFAYPHGEHEQEVLRRVREKFHGALSCAAGNDSDRYCLNRVTVLEESRWSRSRVSIIVPNYNYGRFLREAIDSVLNQSIPPDEVIVIDDASEDDSREVMEEYADKVRLVFNESNLGIVDNFRKAVELTNGDYIAFVGADNRVRSDFVERCKEALDRDEDAAVAYTDVAVFGPRASLFAAAFGATRIAESISERWPIFLWKFPDPTPEVLEGFHERNFVHGSSMYRRRDYDAAGGYLRENPPEDHNLFYRMHCLGRRFAHIKAPVLEYRQHSNRQTNTVLNLELQIKMLRHNLAAAVAQRDAASEKLAELMRKGGEGAEFRRWLAPFPAVTGLVKKALRRLAVIVPPSWRPDLYVRRRRIERSGLFSAAWYLQNNPDVERAGIDPVLHFLLWGAREGRDPGPEFSTRWYLKQNPDVAASGINPLLHFIRNGQSEGRLPRPRGNRAPGSQR